MNPVLEQILRDNTVADESGNLRPLAVHVSTDEGNLLAEWIRKMRPTTSLEVGLGYGISTLFICEAMRAVGGQKHIVMDPDQFGGMGPGFGGIGLANVKRAGFEKLVEFHADYSHHVLPRLDAEGVKVEFAFIDGWHTFDYVLVDFFYIDRLLRPGGILVFDDVIYPSVRKACRYIALNRQYEVLTPQRALPFMRRGLRYLPATLAKPEILQPDHLLGLSAGCVVMRKLADDVLGDGSSDTRRWDQHVPF